MREHTVNESSPSTRVWAGWEELFRRQVQSVLQALLEEEVTEFLGRVKSQRRDPVDHSAGCELAVLQQIGLIGSKFVGAELVGGLSKILSEVGHDSQVITCRDGRVVATLEFLQHHLA